MVNLLGVLPDERRKVALLLLQYVWVVAVTIAGKSARDAFFLTRYNKSLLPLMAIAAAVAVALAVATFTRLERNFRSKTLVPLVCVIFAATLALLHFRLEGWIIPVLYVWMEVINVLTVLQFWLLAAEILDSRQAKRLFPIIGGGGSLAAIIIGPQLKPFSKAYGTDTLLWLVCGLLIGAAAIAMLTTRLPKVPVVHSQPTAKGSKRNRVRSPYLRTIAIIVVCASVVAAIVDYQFKIISSSSLRTESDLVGFFGQFYAATGLSTLVLQFIVASRAFQLFGTVVVMAVLPLMLGLGSMSVLLWPVLASAVLSRFSDQTFRYTLHNGGMELLWLPVSPELRRSAKPFVSGSLKSITEGAAGMLIFLLLYILTLPQLSLISFAFCGAWAFALYKLRSLYVGELQSAIAKRQLPPEDLEVSVTDALTVRVINSALSEGDAAQQLFVLDLIAKLPLAPWRDTFRHLLATGAPEVKARILQIASSDQTIVTQEALKELAGKSGSEAIEAIRTIGTAGLGNLREAVQARVGDIEPTIRAAAFGTLIRLNGAGTSRASDELKAMLSSSKTQERCAALEESSRIAGAITPENLATALKDSAREVRAKALEIAAQQPNDIQADLIADSIGDPMLFGAARRALAALPTASVLPVLVSQLDHKLPTATRRASLRAMRICQIPPAQTALLNEVDARWPLLANQASESLLVVVRTVPISPDASTLADARRSDLVRMVISLDGVISELPDSEDALLIRDYLHNSLANLMPSLIRLAAVRRPDAPVETCIQIIKSQDRARLPFALELLDTLLTPSERQRIVPLFERGSHPSASNLGDARSEELPSNVSAWIKEHLYSEDEWPRAIALDYILCRGASSTIEEIDWQKVPISPLIREVVTSAVRRRPSIEPLLRQRAAATIDEERNHMLTTLEKTILLKSVPLFTDIAAEELSRVAQIADEQTFTARTAICRDGDNADCLYVIVSGSVQIQKRGLELAVLTRATCFGEMAVLDSSPRSADAIALEDTAVLRVGQEQFLETMQSNSHIMQSVVRMLLSRLRLMDEHLADKAAVTTGPRSS